MSDSQQQNHVLLRFVAVERKIASSSARDHKLPQAVFGRAPEQWVIGQNRHGFGDQVDGFQRSDRLGLQQKVHKPTEVGERPRCVD